MKSSRDRLPLKDAVSFAPQATQILAEFAQRKVIQVFHSGELSHFNVALQTTYNRMAMWMSDLCVARDPIHIQIASVCARSIFEHLLDLKWLVTNPASAQSFNDYTVVRRFDIAGKIAKEFRCHKLLQARRLLALPKPVGVKAANEAGRTGIKYGGKAALD